MRDDETARRLARLGILRIKRRRAQPPDLTYWSDPVAWLHDRVRFREGEGPTDYQTEVLAETVAAGRNLVAAHRSCNSARGATVRRRRIPASGARSGR